MALGTPLSADNDLSREHVSTMTPDLSGQKHVGKLMKRNLHDVSNPDTPKEEWRTPERQPLVL